MQLLQRLLNPIPLLTLFCFLFLFLRVIQLPERVTFASDQGRDFLKVLEISQQNEITLIGPPSEYSVAGKQFFFGPASYYVILPAIIIGSGDVISVSYFLIALNLICFLITLAILLRYCKQKTTIWIFALFLTITPALIHYAQSYWNPYLMLPVATLLIGMIVKVINEKKSSLFTFILIGLLFGIGTQFHYGFVLPVLLSIIWLGMRKKISMRSALSLGIGFFIGIAPLILFELRNQFYNTQTFFLVFQQIGSNNGPERFHLNSFYFLGLLPFFFFFMANLLVKITKKYMLLLILGIYALWSLVLFITTPNSELSFPTLQKLSQKIVADQPTTFNIVDQKTTDNRALALRYLLTNQKVIPLDVTEYQRAKTLYIYSDKRLEQLTKNPVWEIASFLPFKNVKTQEVEKDLFLYKLTK